MTKQPTPHDVLTVVKFLAGGRDNQFTAAATGLTVEQVRKIAQSHGYPDKGKLEWAADMLQKQLDDHARGGIPQGTPRPATVSPIRQPGAKPTPPPAPAADAAPTVTSDGSVGQLLDRAAQSTKARTRSLGDRITRDLDDLRQRLDTEDKAAEEERMREAERQAAIDEVRAAEQALEKARAKLRKYKNHPGGNGPAAVARSTTPTAQAARSRAGTATNGKHDYDAKEVRAWAKANGVDCPARGRFLPQHVVDAWREAREEGAA